MKKTGILIALLMAANTLWGQDPEFSQFFANPLYLNPAFAGTSEQPRMALNYRNQWPRQQAAFVTYALSYDQLWKKTNTGLGLQVMRDQEFNNIINRHSVSFSYAYHLQLGFESFMTLGLQGDLVLKQFNAGSLIFPSGIDQLTGTVYEWIPAGNADERRFYPDFGVGAVGQHGEFFWGAAVHHLTQPDESILEGDQEGKVPAKITVHAGARMHRLHYGLLSRVFTLSPNILYQQQGTFKQLNLGLYMIEKSFLFGAWFRNNIDVRPDALIAMAGIAHNRLKVGYSFDLPLSRMAQFSYGSHEISLTLLLGPPREVPVRDKLIIPMI